MQYAPDSAHLQVDLDIKIYFKKKYGQCDGRLVISMGEAWQLAKRTFCAPMSGGSGGWMFLVRIMAFKKHPKPYRYTCTYLDINLYIYIYTEREREREIERVSR